MTIFRVSSILSAVFALVFFGCAPPHEAVTNATEVSSASDENATSATSRGAANMTGDPSVRPSGRKLALAAAGDEPQADLKPVTGKWKLDRKKTAGASREMLPKTIDVNGYVQVIMRSTFDMDVKADGTFTVHQVAAGENAVFSGKWISQGGYVTFNQTHKDGVPEIDRLHGKIGNESMTLIDDAEGFKLPYVVSRVSE